jgi:hypothetical protein
MAEAKRKFYLVGGDSSSSLGLSGFKGKIGRDGLIDTSKLNAGQMDELERMAATDGHPVVEGEPEDIK